ncbi:MAG: hypothetical protein KGK00_17630 [Paracoccaceae bacterium]|nr:hypothetical protein [Paracoccaceae bacterium]
MFDRRFLVILSGLALASCSNAASSVASAPVRVATKAEVARCAYVTNISDKPGLYGALASQGIDYARKAIIDGAAQAGANTVVFDPVDPGTMVTELTATAYRC